MTDTGDTSKPEKIRARFAPSPTGELHLGSARTALFNWLFARHHGGVFVLRIEDTDFARSQQDLVVSLLESLQWLGLDWDEGPEVGGDYGPYFQSERREIYSDYIQRLMEAGRAYECFLTPQELDARREKAFAEDRPFRYEGWHRDLSEREKASFRKEGRDPVIRLRVDAPDEGWVVHDLVKGETRFPPEQIDDFILVRSDGTPSFHLANVVDDALMKITHVLRGEDHLTNTVKHLALFRALGLQPPQYAHLPMILGEDRSKLSKRHGAVSVAEYRRMGFLPGAMINELALLGWSPPDEQERMTREELIRKFDLARCGRSGSIFDMSKLEHFNGLLIREMNLDELRRHLETQSAHLRLEPAKRDLLIELLQDSLVRLGDFEPKAREILDEPQFDARLLGDENLALADEVMKALIPAFEAMPEPWDRTEIKQRIKEAGKAVGAKGKALFFPLRAALTGQLHGPSLDGICAALGRETALGRMRRFLEAVNARAAQQKN